MKYTIEGFSQEYALSLVDEVSSRGGKKEIRLDFADLVILRWFVDYYPNMKKQNIDGEEYALVVYSKVISDLPLLNINKRAIADRFQKLCHFNILKYELIKKDGTFTLFAFGDNYINLIDNNSSAGCCSNDNGGSCYNDNGVAVQPATKDNSIIYSSIKKRKKENKDKIYLHDRNSHDIIMEKYGVKYGSTYWDILKEFLKMCYVNGHLVTDSKLTDIILRLNRYYGDEEEEKVQSIRAAISGGYFDVIELREAPDIYRYY